MFKIILEQIDKIQRSRITGISSDSRGQTLLGDKPPGHCSGLYWLYTNYSIEEIMNCEKAPQIKAVPMNELAKQLYGLNDICHVNSQGFRVVYNGIGGANGSEFGLRERILQEISNNNDKTGSLCIRQSSLNDLSRWKFSFVTQKSLKDNFNSYDIDWEYTDYAKSLERLWRLHYGWPILCRS